MANVFNVARYILQQKGDMSSWKLQKLCYYSQAWSLAWTEVPIFSEEFQAWTNGPVCKELFDKHRGLFTVTLADIPEVLEDVTELTNDQMETIDVVLEHYGNLDPYELREQSHSEDPWRSARGTLPENAPSDNVITKASMGEFYGRL